MNPAQWRALLDKLSEQREEIARLNALLATALPPALPAYGNTYVTPSEHIILQTLLHADEPVPAATLGSMLLPRVMKGKVAIRTHIYRLREKGFAIALSYGVGYSIQPRERERIRAMQ